jgi:predicted transcriptional regulator/rubrerythrin
MARKRTAATSWVQLFQALAAREGVEHLGLSSRRVAELLGLAPSAVSQYLSGKRLEKGFLEFSTDEQAQAVARQAVERLIEAHGEERRRTRIVLEAAAALAELSGPQGRPARVPTPSVSKPPPVRQLTKWLRLRVKAEQVAVTQCMRLAQRAGDELTRTILRQIASDSLRHAEIVASLAPYIERGVSGAYAAGITRKEVEALIEAERRAEAQADSQAARHLQGTMAILIASMEADERKHADLLRGLLTSGFRPAPGGPGEVLSARRISGSPRQTHVR